MLITLNYQVNGLLMGDLTNEHFITENKSVILKTKAYATSAYPIEAIQSNEHLELTDEEYAELIAPWQGYLDFLAKQSVEKYLNSRPA